MNYMENNNNRLKKNNTPKINWNDIRSDLI